jgi:hypothetical protein
MGSPKVSKALFTWIELGRVCVKPFAIVYHCPRMTARVESGQGKVSSTFKQQMNALANQEGGILTVLKGDCEARDLDT